jgi:hypothetical protein
MGELGRGRRGAGLLSAFSGQGKTKLLTSMLGVFTADHAANA